MSYKSDITGDKTPLRRRIKMDNQNNEGKMQWIQTIKKAIAVDAACVGGDCTRKEELRLQTYPSASCPASWCKRTVHAQFKLTFTYITDKVSVQVL